MREKQKTKIDKNLQRINLVNTFEILYQNSTGIENITRRLNGWRCEQVPAKRCAIVDLVRRHAHTAVHRMHVIVN